MILSELWAKNDFFQSDLKKVHFRRNVDIYVDMGYLGLGGHSKMLTCCSGSWRYTGSEALAETINDFEGPFGYCS